MSVFGPERYPPRQEGFCSSGLNTRSHQPDPGSTTSSDRREVVVLPPPTGNRGEKEGERSIRPGQGPWQGADGIGQNVGERQSRMKSLTDDPLPDCPTNSASGSVLPESLRTRSGEAEEPLPHGSEARSSQALSVCSTDTALGLEGRGGGEADQIDRAPAADMVGIRQGTALPGAPCCKPRAGGGTFLTLDFSPSGRGPRVWSFSPSV